MQTVGSRAGHEQPSLRADCKRRFALSSYAASNRQSNTFCSNSGFVSKIGTANRDMVSGVTYASGTNRRIHTKYSHNCHSGVRMVDVVALVSVVITSHPGSGAQVMKEIVTAIVTVEWIKFHIRTLISGFTVRFNTHGRARRGRVVVCQSLTTADAVINRAVIRAAVTSDRPAAGRSRAGWHPLTGVRLRRKSTHWLTPSRFRSVSLRFTTIYTQWRP